MVVLPGYAVQAGKAHMSDEVAVIGGGLGGLSAAVTLAQRGARVVLFEKEPQVGGYAIAFRRQGYTFDLSLHVVPSGAPGAEFSRLNTGLGIAGEVTLLRLEQGFRVCMGDTDFQMPNDVDALFAKLQAEFPAESDGLRALRRNLEGHARVYVPLFDATVSKWRSVPPFLLRLPVFLQHTVLDSKRYVNRYVQDPRLRTILFQPAALMGVPMDHLPTVNFIMMFSIMLGGGMYTIKGGGQAVTDALERRFLALGGTIRTGSEVDKIVVRQGVAVAVRTRAGSEHAVAGVIAGVSPYVLTQHLIGLEYFPAAYLEALRTLRPSMSAAVVSLGLDCHPRALGIHNHMTLLIPAADVGGSQCPPPGSLRLPGFAVTARGVTEPDADPGWGHTLSVVGLANLAPWQALGPEEYRQRKEELIDDVVQRLGQQFPGLPAHIRVRNAATPVTMARYTANPEGAIAGFDCSCGMHRNILRVKKLPLRNVHLAGAWTDRLGGFMQSIRAGVEAGEALARGMGR
jgi:prolycopene isomerase